MVKERIKTTCPHCLGEIDVTAYVNYGLARGIKSTKVRRAHA